MSKPGSGTVTRLVVGGLIAPALVAWAAIPGPASASAGAVAEGRATTSVAGSASTVAQAAEAAKKRRKYSPRTGVRFSDPRGKIRDRINKHIRRSIKSARRGSTIKIATWNYDSGSYTGALLGAHERGVTVRVIMARGLALGQSAGGSYGRTVRGLARNNDRPKSKKSWIKYCRNACRGNTGILHSKFYMFSHAGRSRNVVISTSANMTQAAADKQWNDAMTVVNRQKTWDNFSKIFKQMVADKPRVPAYYQFRDGPYTGWFHPRAAQKHLALRLLTHVKCTGATGGSGVRGRTKIRIGQSVFNGNVGDKIATRVKQLHDAGCNIKLIYTALARRASATMAGIPRRHIAQDFDGDGAYDRYLHMKAITISGNYRGDTDAYITMQGSANWSGMAVQSDEQGLIIRDEAITRKYADYIDRVYADPPRSVPPTVSARFLKDPYSEVEIPEIMRLFRDGNKQKVSKFTLADRAFARTIAE